MIQHVVMLRLKPDYDGTELAAVMDGLGALDIAGFTDFQHGPNRDVENKTPDHRYGFICSFHDLDALNRYAGEPAHQALGARLCALCVGGGDGIMVMDLDV
ncbi:MAG: Dabb family protein [Yoonia sp.]|nr:Dabb family protein [Yoonia sp.]